MSAEVSWQQNQTSQTSPLLHAEKRLALRSMTLSNLTHHNTKDGWFCSEGELGERWLILIW